jgi:SP family xylose:H+ symportor-like MFS transporter
MKIFRISFVAVIGGFLFGYDTAVISGAVESLNKFFIVPLDLSEKTSNTLLGFLVSCALIGCVIGSTSGGYFSQKFGRKRMLMLAAILFIISSIGSAQPELGIAHDGSGNSAVIFSFIIFRIIGGIGIGIASVLSPMYIAEVSPAHLRGQLVSWNQMAITMGILIVYIVNYLIAKNGNEAWNISFGWRWMFASMAFPSLMFFILLWFVPESPRWLILSGKDNKAIDVLTHLNGPSQAKTEYEDIKSSLKMSSGRILSFGIMILVIGMLLSTFQQLVGIQVMMYYAPEIIKNMGRSTNSAMFQAILVGAVNVLFTVIAIYTVDKAGRKPLLLVGSFLMMVFMFILGVTFLTNKMGILSLISVLGFVGAFAFSWGPVTWVLLSEMFPNSIRSKAMALAVAVQWIVNYTVSSTFPLLDRSSWLVSKFNHSVSFWLFGLMALLSFLFVWYMVPETKGKTLEQMEGIWNSNRK